MECFFPRIEVVTCAQMQNYWGDGDVDHTQIIGGNTVKLLGEIYPPSPRVSAPLMKRNLNYTQNVNELMHFINFR